MAPEDEHLDPARPLDDLGGGGFLARLSLVTHELVEELGLESLKIHSASEVDVMFLAFLRLTSRFGIFNFGPINIHVPTVEDAVLRSVRRAPAEPDPGPVKLLTELIRAEWARSGRRNVEDLHVLLAFMRLGEGVPGEVFGELGIRPKQVEDFARTGLHGARPEQLETLYSTEEVAAYLHVNTQTVREWIRTGRLPAVRLAGQRAFRVRFRDIQTVLEPVEGEKA